MAKVHLMVTSLFTTHFLVTTTVSAKAAVDLDAQAVRTACTDRILSLAVAKAQAMSKAVTTAAVAVAQEPHGQAHRATAVLVASELFGVHQDHVRIPRTPRKELRRCRNIIYL